jgi:hypothetical protein
MSGNTGIREQARKDLRKYDNPESGRNSKYGDEEYLIRILFKYDKVSLRELREWSNEVKHRRD